MAVIGLAAYCRRIWCWPGCHFWRYTFDKLQPWQSCLVRVALFGTVRFYSLALRDVIPSVNMSPNRWIPLDVCGSPDVTNVTWPGEVWHMTRSWCDGIVRCCRDDLAGWLKITLIRYRSDNCSKFIDWNMFSAYQIVKCCKKKFTIMLHMDLIRFITHS